MVVIKNRCVGRHNSRYDSVAMIVMIVMIVVVTVIVMVGTAADMFVSIVVVQ